MQCWHVFCLVSYIIRLSSNNIVTNMTIAGQRFGKHVPSATNRRSNTQSVRGGGRCTFRPELEKRVIRAEHAMWRRRQIPPS
jgi:hypothetical protein